MKRQLKHITRGLSLWTLLFAVFAVSSCKDSIDESDMYTFTGETAYSYLEKSEDYNMFAYLLTRVKLSKKSDSELAQLLSARGNYTIFAPTNEALQSYLDSIYVTPNFNITQVTDSIAEFIARNAIIDNKDEEAYQAADFIEGSLDKTNMDDRYITVQFDTINNGQLATIINTRSRIIQPDIEVTNGYIHGLNHVLELSRATLPALIEEADNLLIFNEILVRTGWDQAMTQIRDEDYEVNHAIYGRDLSGNLTVRNPEHRYYGYTAFVETDSLFCSEWGIPEPILENDKLQNGDEIMRAISEKCQEAYPEYTDPDLKSTQNAVNQFMAYHLLGARLTWDRLVFHHIEMYYAYLNPDQLTIDCFEYYETFANNRKLLKITEGRDTNGKRINRHATYDLNTYYESGCDREGLLISMDNGRNLTNAVNGFYYPIDHILLYDEDVPGLVLNERLRWDISSLLPELITNGYRGIFDQGTHPFPLEYFDRLQFTDESWNCYLPYQTGNSQTNYQADEFNIRGQYDFTFRLPPVPNEGTYELRFCAPCNTGFGMAQFYFGSNKQNLQPVGLPVDLRVSPYGPVIGYDLDRDDEDYNRQIDKDMRNKGYMKPPRHDGISRQGQPVTESMRSPSVSYPNNVRLRKIIWTGNVKPSDVLYIRVKSVLNIPLACFLLDYMEWCPKNVYASPEGEDQW